MKAAPTETPSRLGVATLERFPQLAPALFRFATDFAISPRPW
jgi:hypothetical protein